MTPPTFVIGAGGTAGHVVPAMAVADALRADGAEVAFIGGERAELELVPAAGYELRTLRVQPLYRGQPLTRGAGRGGRHRPRSGAPAGCSASCAPAAVLGAGGYVAGPVGLAAVFRRMPLVLIEADSHLGRDQSAARPDGAPGVPGVPDRRAAMAGATASPAGRCRRRRPTARPRGSGSGFRRSETCVLVFGGSQGARSINQAAVEAFAGARFHVLHAAGERDLPDLQAPGPHYDLRGYISDFGEALLASDLVVARSGGSIFEIAAHGRPDGPDPVPVRHRRPPDRQRAVHGARGGRDRDPRRRAHRGPAGARGRRAAGRPRAAGRRWRAPRPRWPSRTRRRTSPASCGPAAKI